MPQRPVLIFPKPTTVEREKLPRSNIVGKKLSRGWQEVHVGKPLQQLQASLERRSLSLSTAAVGTIAEEVLVLETIGTVDDFISAVRRIPGLEWLVSFDSENTTDDAENEEYAEIDEEDDSMTASNRVFALSTNAEALRQLLSLWNRYTKGEAFAHGFGAWKKVFAHLKDVRFWSAQDRIGETGVIEFWQEALEMGLDNISFTVELWFRSNDALRAVVYRNLSVLAESLGGSLSHPYEHKPTAFHGAIANMPPSVVKQFIEDPLASAFLQRTEVMFCRPLGQTAVQPSANDGFIGDVRAPRDAAAGEPIAALLDGLPIENHAAYDGWLRVDDPDNWAADYEAGDRNHGTGMASLIIRGDLGVNEDPISSPLYVRPILRVEPNDHRRPRREAVPSHRFAQDLLEIAIRRLKHGSFDVAPTARSVQVVNLSVGDTSRIFDGTMSPWARMIDFLSWKYNLLFVVSAGNHPALNMGMTLTAWEALSQEEREREAFIACWNDVRNRRLLSPSESINALTVAARHIDGNTTLPPLGSTQFMPVQSSFLSSLTSAIGPGNRRSIKPDLTFPGGQQVMRWTGSGLTCIPSDRPPGQLVAAPRISLTSTAHTRGTSNAAALCTRQAIKVMTMLRSLGGESPAVPEEYLPVLAKSMLAHAASAADGFNRLRQIFDPSLAMRVDQFRKRYVLPFMGYGSVDLQRSLGADDHRATLIGWGKLRKEQAHQFDLPIPSSLNAFRGKRRITLTLAWISPINPNSRAYRIARLWISKPSALLGTSRSESEWRTVRSGTLQHEIWEGEGAVPFADGSTITIRVNCREDGGALADAVRYGLAVSIEAASQYGLPIYEEVNEAINIREPIRG